MSTASGDIYDKIAEVPATNLSVFVTSLDKTVGEVKSMTVLTSLRDALSTACSHKKHAVKEGKPPTGFATFPCGHGMCMDCISYHEHHVRHHNPVCSVCVDKLQKSMVSWMGGVTRRA
jgi:hypothetical protein